MIILSFGFKQPENGDAGSIWFPALNSDIQQLNDHNHDGSNSSLINGSAVVGGIVNILSAGWVGSPGNYSQVASCPAGYNMSNSSISVFDSSGNVIAPSIDFAGSTSFTIFSPDNTVDLVVLFK